MTRRCRHKRKQYKLRSVRRRSYISKTLIIMLLMFAVAIIFMVSMVILYAMMDRESVKTAHMSDISSTGCVTKDEILREDFSEWNQRCEYSLLLIDAKNPLPESHIPKFQEHFGIVIDERIKLNLGDLLNAAEADGIKLKAVRGAGDPMESLGWENYGKESENSGGVHPHKMSMKDEHCTGLVVELGPWNEAKREEAYAWMVENSTEYGFIQRNPGSGSHNDVASKDAKRWQFRYIGVQNALRMKELGMGLEAYISYLIFSGS